LHIVKLKKCIKINTCHSRQIFGGGIWLGSCHEICWVALCCGSCSFQLQATLSGLKMNQC